MKTVLPTWVTVKFRERRALWMNGSFCVLPAVRYRCSWKLIWWSPRFFMSMQNTPFLVSVYRVCTCVFCACSRHVCVFFVFLMHRVLSLCPYFSRCKEKLYFGELQRSFVWTPLPPQKKIKVRGFYENVKWRHLSLKIDIIPAVIVLVFCSRHHNTKSKRQ